MFTLRSRRPARTVATLLLIAVSVAPLCAQPTLPAAPAGAAVAPASLTGRVLNQSTARFVNNARVVVKGTALQTFTDSAGVYFLDGLARRFVHQSPAEGRDRDPRLRPARRA
jgi:hypothetical protein